MDFLPEPLANASISPSMQATKSTHKFFRFEALPNELFLPIVETLPLLDVIHFAATSKYLTQLLLYQENGRLWQYAFGFSYQDYIEASITINQILGPDSYHALAFNRPIPFEKIHQVLDLLKDDSTFAIQTVRLKVIALHPAMHHALLESYCAYFLYGPIKNSMKRGLLPVFFAFLLAQTLDTMTSRNIANNSRLWTINRLSELFKQYEAITIFSKRPQAYQTLNHSFDRFYQYIIYTLPSSESKHSEIEIATQVSQILWTVKGLDGYLPLWNAIFAHHDTMHIISPICKKVLLICPKEINIQDKNFNSQITLYYLLNHTLHHYPYSFHQEDDFRLAILLHKHGVMLNTPQAQEIFDCLGEQLIYKTQRGVRALMQSFENKSSTNYNAYTLYLLKWCQRHSPQIKLNQLPMHYDQLTKDVLQNIIKIPSDFYKKGNQTTDMPPHLSYCFAFQINALYVLSTVYTQDYKPLINAIHQASINKKEKLYTILKRGMDILQPTNPSITFSMRT